MSSPPPLPPLQDDTIRATVQRQQKIQREQDARDAAQSGEGARKTRQRLNRCKRAQASTRCRLSLQSAWKSQALRLT